MIRAEFSIYPFGEGESLPIYVQAAIDAVRTGGIDVEVGILGEAVMGEAATVLEAVRIAAQAAIDAGAGRVVVNIEVDHDAGG
jgi:uncharacterized protein YqgV (UPF0045/DUF77 family)